MSEILAPGLGEGVTPDIGVVAGTPINVGLFRADDERIERTCVGAIYRLNTEGTYNHTGFTLNRDSPNMIIVGAGTYQVRRSGGFEVPTGIQAE